jgi:hypothetical protein
MIIECITDEAVIHHKLLLQLWNFSKSLLYLEQGEMPLAAYHGECGLSSWKRLTHKKIDDKFWNVMFIYRKNC